LKFSKIDENNIRIFVIDFYKRIIEDKEVGPFFIDILGDDINNKKWQEHIDTLCDFWSSMILKTNNYVGSPFAPHTTLKGLKKETFNQWLKILDECVDNIYDKNCAKQFKTIGNIISENFMEKLGI